MAEKVTRLERLKRLNYHSYAELGEALGVHGNTARRLCQWPGASDWIWMNAASNANLKSITHGQLHAGNYYELVGWPSSVNEMLPEQEKAA